MISSVTFFRSFAICLALLVSLVAPEGQAASGCSGAAARLAFARAASRVLSLRYDIEVKGLDQILARGTKGILFLPNHPALTDPVILTSLLYPEFQPIPAMKALTPNRTVSRALSFIARPFLRLLGVKHVPRVRKQNVEREAQVEALFRDLAADLMAGKNVIFYPGGTLQGKMLQTVEGKSGVKRILDAAPDTRIVLVNIGGLWGSHFSRALTGGKIPAVRSALKAFVSFCFNLAKFPFKRKVTVEFVEPDDFPRHGTRGDINRYLTRFQQSHAEPAFFVPLTAWEGKPRVVPDAPRQEGYARKVPEIPVPDQVRAEVNQYFAKLGLTEIHDSQELGENLDMDSLDRVALKVWLENTFGGDTDRFHVDSVGDAMRYAALHAPARRAPKRKRVVAIIPARLGSTRFPGKPLALIDGKPMIQHVWENAMKAKSLSGVVIATDHETIASKASGFGAIVAMTPDNLNSGSDRVALVAEQTNADYILNIQGDEPLLPPEAIDKLVEALEKNPDASIATLAVKLDPAKDLDNPNVVKVTVSDSNRAENFTRQPVPTDLKHVGIYLYKKEALEKFCKLPQSPREKAERLEQWRALDNGMKIQIVLLDRDTIAVDTPEDVAKVEAEIRARRQAAKPAILPPAGGR